MCGCDISVECNILVMNRNEENFVHKHQKPRGTFFTKKLEAAASNMLGGNEV